MAKMKIERCRVLRTYSGAEGRPRKGEVFIVEGKPVEGFKQISRSRFNALFGRGLVEPTAADAATGAKTDDAQKDKRDAPHPKKVEPVPAKKKPVKDPASAVRQQAGRKTGLPGNGPNGGLIGANAPLSSSEVEQARGTKAQTKDGQAESTGSESPKRGERRESPSSPSTTPTSSSKDSTPSTPAISGGGGHTKADAGESGLE